MRQRSLRGVNEHVDPIFNAVLPSAGTFQTSPRVLSHDKGRRSFLRRPLCKRLGNRLPSAGFPILHVLQVLFSEVGLGSIVEDTSGELEHLLLFLVEVMSDQMLQLLGAGKPAR